ncbi:MAG: DUF4253 domain-containing protein [Asticcacaulis sp.]|uniref:DUF4253 domain-containing protein n=1 Tax=Asticcacaulis sp. TaxID=1872648 RepID=UPI0039E4D3DE
MRLTRRWLMGAFGALIPFTAKAADTQGAPVPPSLDTLLASFPYKVITTTGEKALAEWSRLKTNNEGWPVVVGSEDDLRMLLENFSYAAPRTPVDILKAADALTLPKDLIAWQATNGYGGLGDPVGEWPAQVDSGNLGLSVAIDILTDKPLATAYIIMVPTTHSWEVPAYLRWGNWNACPPPEYHVALLRSWHERFGAEIAGLSGDVLNLQIIRPLREKDEALAVAREQYVYCADLVEQGVGSLSALAATLIGQDWWYFWWD